MRLLLGALILLTLFSAAALWQRSWTKEARSSREPFPSSPQERTPAVPGDGWSRVLLGRPSGGEPHVERTDAASGGPPRGTHEESHESLRDRRHDLAQGTESSSTDPRAPEEDVVVTVQAGQTLSEICRDRYGSARLELVLAVARYNHLARPDEIREGQRILLPASERLRAER